MANRVEPDSADQTTTTPDRRRGLRLVIALTIRVLVVLYFVSTFLQAVLAGLFVTGNVGMLAMHEINAHTNLFLLFLLIIAAVLLRWPVGGPGWPIIAFVLLAVLVFAQTEMGFMRVIDLHIPVGVLLFGISVALLIWVFTARFDVSRRTVRRRG
ncbi:MULTISPECIES: hypothetical protein [Actinoalloteichus]|uniref:Uncharacterized protein n=1 Tax=Actinoalloteichus fjordicus TaxID=1612552 RepID=A0AAC9LAK2_9PSEU|nr:MULTISPECIES: hypothetical protein [Actinoalloteichus]APU14233.1 hypothetical protein UA74_10865 [Actinoalloteichus fjordicus]APU20202.1 hypothetical protein UA75_10950 [Actinoalloteichus sp. GBA129-24]